MSLENHISQVDPNTLAQQSRINSDPPGFFYSLLAMGLSPISFSPASILLDSAMRTYQTGGDPRLVAVETGVALLLGSAGAIMAAGGVWGMYDSVRHIFTQSEPLTDQPAVQVVAESIQTLPALAQGKARPEIVNFQLLKPLSETLTLNTPTAEPVSSVVSEGKGRLRLLGAAITSMDNALKRAGRQINPYRNP